MANFDEFSRAGVSSPHTSINTRQADEAMSTAVRTLEELDLFDEFCHEVLPILRQDLKAGHSPETLRNKYASILQARLISIGLNSKDEAIALSAIKDLIDRREGRAIERKAVAHRFEKLSDKELDSLLLSELEETESLPKNES